MLIRYWHEKKGPGLRILRQGVMLVFWTALAIYLALVLIRVTFDIDRTILVPTMLLILAGLLTVHYRRKKKQAFGTPAKRQSDH